MTIVDHALDCGFEILSRRRKTVVEITGNGDWPQLEHRCKQRVRRSVYDHVSIIIQDANGNRELRDIGMGETRVSPLPPAIWRQRQHHEFLRGVVEAGHGYYAYVTLTEDGKQRKIRLGRFDSRMEAGMARDRYVLERGLSLTLNFPSMMKVVQAEREAVVVE